AEQWDLFDSLNPTTGQFTIPSAGWYEVEFRCVFGAATTGQTGHRAAYIDLNGVQAATRQLMPPPFYSEQGYGVTVNATIQLLAGDVIRPQAYHSQGTGITVNGGLESGPMEWKVTRIR